MDTSDCECFPCLPENVGSQKCHVSRDLYVALNGTLGHPCWVSHRKKKYLCLVWPKKDLHQNHMYLDETVVFKGDLSEDISGSLDNTSSISICQSKSEVVETISLDIVLSDYSRVPYFKQNLDVLVKTVKELLHFTVIAPSCIVNAEKLPLGKVYGVKYVIVLSQSVNKFTCCTVGPSTEVVIHNIESIDRYRQRSQFKTISLGGMLHAKTALNEMVEMLFTKREIFRQLRVTCPCSVLLRGPPGTGKTSLVKLVAIQSGAFVLTVIGSELLGSRPGETEENLRKVFRKAQTVSEEGPCILFLDEVDSFCSKQGKGSSNEKRVLSQLLHLLDEIHDSDSSCVMVIAATSRPHVLDPALRRPGRLDREIFLGIPGQTEREDILMVLLRDIHLHVNVQLGQLAEATPGYVGADLKLLVQQACYNALRKHNNNVRDLVVCQEELHKALHNTTPSSQKGSDVFVDHKPVKWEDIGGLEDVKAKIRQFIEVPIKHPEAFSRLGLPPPRGVLLYGPPGCAKTTLVRAAATSCHVTFLSISGAQLYSPFVGDSGKKISGIFQQARAGAPCILFLDEIDSIVGSRSRDGTKQGSVQERVLSTLLNELDGVGIKVDSLSHSDHRIAEGEGVCHNEGHQLDKVDNKSVLFVAATNRPDNLDDAILRPGRIDRIIYVPPPDLETRREILHVHTANMSTDNDLNLECIASSTENFTGADLENLCREAALYALTVDGIEVNCVKQEHFDAVLETVQPSLSAEQISLYSDYTRS